MASGIHPTVGSPVVLLSTALLLVAASWLLSQKSEQKLERWTQTTFLDFVGG